MKGGVITALIVAAALLGVLALLYAQGAPTAPNAQLYTPITPGSGQALIIQFQFGFYSISSPNTVYGEGMHITYSVVERSSLTNTATVLVNNLTVAPVIVSQSGEFYIMQASQSVNTVAACTGIACSGVIENITVTTQASIVTPYVTWFSQTTSSVFSSLTASGCTQGVPCPPVSTVPAGLGTKPVPSTVAQNTFFLELFVPLTAIVAIGAFVVLVMGGKHPVFLGTAIAATLAIVVEFLVW